MSEPRVTLMIADNKSLVVIQLYMHDVHLTSQRRCGRKNRRLVVQDLGGGCLHIKQCDPLSACPVMGLVYVLNCSACFDKGLLFDYGFRRYK